MTHTLSEFLAVFFILLLTMLGVGWVLESLHGAAKRYRDDRKDKR